MKAKAGKVYPAPSASKNFSVGKKGWVYLVGAGPGDFRLITVKGLELIKKADVIIYDFLINKELLTFAKKGTELVCAGKSRQYPKGRDPRAMPAGLHCHSMEQGRINELLVEKTKKAKVVVRLKSGDPFIFGRGAEEAAYLAKRNIPYEVVPGVSSAAAVPASCGIPLTHRDYASSVAIITGHRKDDESVKFINADTLVYLMAVTNLKKITRNLIKDGKSSDTPCILIERGTFHNQKVVQGNLGNIFKKSKREKINPPAVFVVGEVVNLRQQLNNIRYPVQRRSKTQKRVLFTGINPARFKNLGKILHCPMIKIVPLADYSKIKREIKQIGKYHWIIFTSRYGVKYFFNIFKKKKKDISQINPGLSYHGEILRNRKGGVKTCAIGRTTADELKKYGVKVDCIPEEESSQGIIEAFKKFDLSDKNVLIPRSKLSVNYLPCALREMGAHIKTVSICRSIKPLRVKRIAISGIDEIIFTSPSTIKNFMAGYKTIPKGIKIKCIGNVTCSELKKYGLSGEVMAE